MDSKNVDEIIIDLEDIRKRRRERGDIFLTIVLEASKSIKKRYGDWYEKAIGELYTEIALMNELVPYDELDKLRSELLTLKDAFETNKRDLDDFVNAIERHEIKSFEELEVSGTNPPPEYLSSTLGGNKRTRNLSVVFESFRIAKQVEEIEKKVEKMSKFMMNVILLMKRWK